MKPGATGVKRIFNAAGYSAKGLMAAWRHEEAFRLEVMILVAAVVVSWWLPVTPIERLAMIASVVLVIIVELLNSAIEAVVDRISDEYHDLSGRAKDIGSAAVMVSMILCGLTWLVILLF
ncbi:diacylglycerol kinase [Photobacterium ganghwense]|uniref:diacylglycerol kinase n=1 Tax=Photobacterium ganghwense TaxID=320778 RepID=UPI001A8F3D18|nr:diacylglycerol kinase [Photobacterium ganghwense]QSV16592.1 diacylglycerol kinase [Photobacterium ganghwense]